MWYNMASDLLGNVKLYNSKFKICGSPLGGVTFILHFAFYILNCSHALRHPDHVS